MIQKIILWLSKVLHWDNSMPSTDNISTITLETPVEATVSPKTAPSEATTTETTVVSPKVDLVRKCALAQKTFEGFSPGSNSYRHNNPGNIRGLDGNFLTFTSYEAGFAALEDYIRRVATGKHKAYPLGGKTTINQYCHTYTSDKEPSPTNYAAAIARATGLSTGSPMSALLA